MSNSNHVPATFGLVHGAYHGAWCWELLQNELHAMGHDSVAVDLPIDDPEATFDDYADVVADSMKGTENLVLVGHSRAGNVVPRVAGKIVVNKLIYLSASFQPVTIGRPLPSEKKIMPQRNTLEYLQGIQPIGDEMTTIDRAVAKHVFYHDCDDATANAALDRLRLQRRSQAEPVLASWPDTHTCYIICKDDRVVCPDWSRYVAKHWLGDVPVTEIAGGHSPFLSRPRELAEILISHT